jgi:RNA polymerase sigma factor (sigma-70 family)
MSQGLQSFLNRLRTGSRPLSDRELVAAVAGGRGHVVFEEIIGRHGSMVLHVCQRLLRHREDAEDAFQATFVVLYRRADRIRKPESLASWLHGVAVRVAREMLAARQRCRAADVTLVEAPAFGDPNLVVQAEMADVLDAEVAKLRAHYRTALVLCELQGRSRKDAANELGIPEGTLSSRLAKAKKLLADRLLARGLTAVTITALLANQSTAAVPASLGRRTTRLLAAAASADAETTRLLAGIHDLANGVVKSMIAEQLRRWSATVAPLLVSAAGLLAVAVATLVGPATPVASLLPVASAAPLPAARMERINYGCCFEIPADWLPTT